MCLRIRIIKLRQGHELTFLLDKQTLFFLKANDVITKIEHFMYKTKLYGWYMLNKITHSNQSGACLTRHIRYTPSPYASAKCLIHALHKSKSPGLNN